MNSIQFIYIQFNIVKLGFTEEGDTFILFLFQSIDCGYSLDPPRSTHNLRFE